MSKLFGEAFPSLKLNEELESLFENTKVERISTPSTRTYLHIYVSSDHLIPKQWNHHSPNA